MRHVQTQSRVLCTVLPLFKGDAVSWTELQRTKLATVSYPTSHAKFRSLLPEIVPFNFRPIWDKYRYQCNQALEPFGDFTAPCTCNLLQPLAVYSS